MCDNNVSTSIIMVFISVSYASWTSLLLSSVAIMLRVVVVLVVVVYFSTVLGLPRLRLHVSQKLVSINYMSSLRQSINQSVIQTLRHLFSNQYIHNEVGVMCNVSSNLSCHHLKCPLILGVTLCNQVIPDVLFCSVIRRTYHNDYWNLLRAIYSHCNHS